MFFILVFYDHLLYILLWAILCIIDTLAPGYIHTNACPCLNIFFSLLGKGGKNRRRGKNENESEKRELVFKEDGQGKAFYRS